MAVAIVAAFEASVGVQEAGHVMVGVVAKSRYAAEHRVVAQVARCVQWLARAEAVALGPARAIRGGARLGHHGDNEVVITASLAREGL